MTPAQKLGYKVGDMFRVLEETWDFKVGEVVEFTRDDDSDCPRFDGNDEYGFVQLDNLEKLPTTSDVPAHYDNIIQPWEYMRATFSIAEYRGYMKGNIIKYISRYQQKGGVADLYKLRAYQEELVRFEEEVI